MYGRMIQHWEKELWKCDLIETRKCYCLRFCEKNQEFVEMQGIDNVHIKRVGEPELRAGKPEAEGAEETELGSRRARGK